MADYQGKKVVIIGLGMTGLSCVDFFMARGVTPRVIVRFWIISLMLVLIGLATLKVR